MKFLALLCVFAVTVSLSSALECLNCNSTSIEQAKLCKEKVHCTGRCMLVQIGGNNKHYIEQSCMAHPDHNNHYECNSEQVLNRFSTAHPDVAVKDVEKCDLCEHELCNKHNGVGKAQIGLVPLILGVAYITFKGL